MKYVKTYCTECKKPVEKGIERCPYGCMIRGKSAYTNILYVKEGAA